MTTTPCPYTAQSLLHTPSLLIAAAKWFGSHFFDRDTMRSFRSRLQNEIRPAASGKVVLFVTSEQFETYYPRYRRDSRKFTLRSLNLETGFIDTIGEFQQYNTRAQAVAALKREVNNY